MLPGSPSRTGAKLQGATLVLHRATHLSDGCSATLLLRSEHEANSRCVEPNCKVLRLYSIGRALVRAGSRTSPLVSPVETMPTGEVYPNHNKEDKERERDIHLKHICSAPGKKLQCGGAGVWGGGLDRWRSDIGAPALGAPPCDGGEEARVEVPKAQRCSGVAVAGAGISMVVKERT